MKITTIERNDETTTLKFESLFAKAVVSVSTKAYEYDKKMYEDSITQIINDHVFGKINSTIFKVGIACIMLYGLSKLLGY